jgi:hypothetical protein
MKNAQEANARAAAALEATQRRFNESMDLRERVHADTVARDRDLLDIRRQIADISRDRVNNTNTVSTAQLYRAFAAIAEDEADKLYPLSELEKITGVVDSAKTAQRTEFVRRRLEDLGFSGSPLSMTLTPSHPPAAAPSASSSKAAQAAAIVRGRNR